MAMRIEAITPAYNEEFLLPFFLKHYSFVDRINVLFDVASTDRSREILEACPNVHIIENDMPEGMNSFKINGKILETYQNITSQNCWVLGVDVDEFVFLDPRDLEHDSLICDYSYVKLYDVYRHVTEKDLDASVPVKYQRRHGFLREDYRKPAIVKAGLKVKWGLGLHSIASFDKGPYRIRQVDYTGAHWANADLCFCVERRVKNRRDRQSAYNLEHGFTVQHHHVSEKSILDECNFHSRDPLVF
jgi:hypothetical protein